MVTQRTPLSAPSPPNGPVRPRQPSDSPLALEPRRNSVREHVDNSPDMSSSSHPLLQGTTQPAKAWEPRAGVPTTGTSAQGQEENVWDEPSHPPGYYELSRPVAAVRTSETNPFLRKPVPSTNSNGTSPHPTSTQQQQQQSQLNESFSRLVFDEQSSSHNPWQAAMDAGPSRAANINSHPQSAVPSDVGTDPWARSTPDPSAKEPQAPRSPALVSLQSDGSGWEDASDDDEHDDEKPDLDASGGNDSNVRGPAMNDELARDQHVWDDGPGLAASTQAGPEGPPQTLGPRTANSPGSGSGRTSGSGSGSGSTPLDDWNMVESDIYSPSPKNPSPSRESQTKSGEAGEAAQAPVLPPRSTGEQARWSSSRLPPNAACETYQVKNIRWHDAGSDSNLRASPILIQNQNGPCPLVALVNALTLTTPADVSGTSLVSVLCSREQVSLSLLLDAVFDELMSTRRTSDNEPLPDVTDLYSFLQSLHTGMNVNPRFIPTPEMVEAFKRTSLTHVDPDERGKFVPGTFENTLEMSLYAAFSIPLIHGWLPPMDHPAYGAMHRHAASYEDTQNLLFREEELERKFSTDSGLTEAEQSLYQDIVTIRMFLDSSATQLTPWGIEVIGKVMRPGTFAILFRNDHFSTLYCHPETLQLYTLVTDAGYESHSDIVWESLLDVNGVYNEYLSGDFKPLASVAATSHDAGHVPSHRGAAAHGTGKAQDTQAGMPISPEQEDRDLALALQLQEEEDQKHRRHEARRKREAILSERYIEQASRRPGAQVDPRTGNQLAPPRRSSNSINVAAPVPTTTTTAANVPSSRRRDATPRHPAPTHFDQMQRIQQQQQQQQGRLVPPVQFVRPLVPPPRRPGVNRPAQEDDEPPPPSYEQAAQVPAYHPPPGHPTHPGSVASMPSRRGAAMNASPHATVGAPGAGFSDGGQRLSNVSSGRRAPVPVGGMATSRERECVIM